MYIEARVNRQGGTVPAFQIDECFLEEVSSHRWCLNGHGYLCAFIDNQNVMLSRYVWLLHTGEWPKNQVDHISRDKLDNRVANLRDVSCSENLKNKTPGSWMGVKKAKKSGLPTGVFFDKRAKSRPYGAQVVFQRKNKKLGMFATPEEASAAYQAAVTVLKEQANAR